MALLVAGPAGCGDKGAAGPPRDTLLVQAPDSLSPLPWVATYEAAAAHASHEWQRRDRPANVALMIVRIAEPAPPGHPELTGQTTFNFSRAQLDGREPMVRTGSLQVETTRTRGR